MRLSIPLLVYCILTELLAVEAELFLRRDHASGSGSGSGSGSSSANGKGGGFCKHVAGCEGEICLALESCNKTHLIGPPGEQGAVGIAG